MSVPFGPGLDTLLRGTRPERFGCDRGATTTPFAPSTRAAGVSRGADKPSVLTTREGFSHV